MIFRLDGAKMTGRQGTHEHIKEILGLPEYYGRNLDALHDVLTELSAKIVIENYRDMEKRLGGYAGAVIKTFMDAAAENPNLEVSVE